MAVDEIARQRIDGHEMLCVERHTAIRNDLKTINQRMWGLIVAALAGALGSVGTLVVLLMEKS